MPGQYVGSSIAAVFGLIYVQVNTSTLPAAVQWPLRAIALGALVAVAAMIYRRRGRSDGEGGELSAGRGFGRAYWIVVLIEVVALFAGLRVLSGPLDLPEAGVTWVSLVVGIHFFALAVVFRAPFFHVLGAAVTACGAVGLVLAVAGASQSAVDTVAGVVPGLLLLAFALWGVNRGPITRAAEAPPLRGAAPASRLPG